MWTGAESIGHGITLAGDLGAAPQGPLSPPVASTYNIMQLFSLRNIDEKSAGKPGKGHGM